MLALGFDADADGVAAALSAVAVLTDLPAGTLIFNEGELHNHVYFIVRGTVALEMLTAGAGKQRILTMGEGDLLSWSALLGAGRMTSSATALEPVRLLEFDATVLGDLCRQNHEVGYVIMTRVAEALSRRLLATRIQLLDVYQVQSR
jgi:CRP-like cAMP-binding protein